MLPVSHSWVRQILAFLFERGPATRTEIARVTGLNMGSVSRASRYLVQAGVVASDGELPRAAGRRPTLLRLNAESWFFLCMDLEGTRVRVGLAGFNGDIRYRWGVPVALGEYFSERLLVKGIASVLSSLSVSERERVLAAGVSYTGIMNPEGRVTALNLGWKDFPLKEAIAAAANLPAFYGTESLVKLLAERRRGVAKGKQDVVFVTIANGVGCAIVSSGQPLIGRDGAAGELGHVVVDPGVLDQCQCGKKGCLEAIASSPSIVRQYMAKVGSEPHPILGEHVVQVFERAREGDRAALEVVDRAAYYLGVALSNVANLVNPELIVLGGDAVYGDDLLLPRIREEIARHCLPTVRSGLEVKVSALGLDVGLIGAASLAFDGAVRDTSTLNRIASCQPQRPLELSAR
jgi:glucokinase